MNRLRIVGSQDKISDAGALVSNLKIYPPGSIAVVFRSGVLRHSLPVAIGEVHFTVNQDIKVLEARVGVDPRYAFHILRGLERKVIASAVKSGTTVESVDFSVFQSLPVHLPPLEEQRRVADILGNVDTQIELTEQLIAKLQLMKRGLLHDLLTRGIDENGELRDPERHPEQFKYSAWGLLPKAWRISSVDSEFDVQSGVTLGPHRRPRQSPHPYLRVANVYSGRFDLSDIAHLEARPNEIAHQLLEPGDLLVVEGHADVRQIGRCAMANESVAGMTFQNHLFRLRSRGINPKFAETWMNGEWTRQYWRRTSVTSSGLRTINQPALKAVGIPVPPPDEQAMIVELIDSTDKRVLGEQSTLVKLQQLKQGLMSDLLTGRVRTADLESNASA
jgi:type I restriction enzyme S subunit